MAAQGGARLQFKSKLGHYENQTRPLGVKQSIIPELWERITLARFENEARYGSIASFWSLADYFRSSPGNGHRQGWSACLKVPEADINRTMPKSR